MVYNRGNLSGFEYDPAQSEANANKHGIDFEAAQHLWRHPVVRLKSKNRAEDRELVVGVIGLRFWTAIIAMRGGKIRLISVRRSRDEEKEIYREHFGSQS